MPSFVTFHFSHFSDHLIKLSSRCWISGFLSDNSFFNAWRFFKLYTIQASITALIVSTKLTEFRHAFEDKPDKTSTNLIALSCDDFRVEKQPLLS